MIYYYFAITCLFLHMFGGTLIIRQSNVDNKALIIVMPPPKHDELFHEKTSSVLIKIVNECDQRL